jgi:hypothetical protein
MHVNTQLGQLIKEERKRLGLVELLCDQLGYY